MPQSSKMKSDPTVEFRERQSAELAGIMEQLEIELAKARRQRVEKSNLLESVSAGLYDEVDKLTKKAPAEAVTDLMLEQVNDVIRETKELVAEDVYVQRLKEFVPAGDNPQLRDVIIVLRQIRQGLGRFNAAAGSFINNANGLLSDARIVKLALDAYLQTGVTVDSDYFREQLGTAASNWITADFTHLFNWAKLDRLPLSEHFSIE